MLTDSSRSKPISSDINVFSDLTGFWGVQTADAWKHKNIDFSVLAA